MKSILVIGPTYCDLLLHGFTGIPTKGEESYLEGYNISLGGMAITAAALAQMEIPTALVTTLGEDSLGNQLSQDLSAKGIDLTYSLPKIKDNSNLTIVLPIEGDRSFLTCEQSNEIFEKEVELRLSKVEPKQFSHIHISFSLLKSPKVISFLGKVKSCGGTISSDLGFADTESWGPESDKRLSIMDYFLPNDDEALRITGTNNVKTALTSLKQHLPSPIITMGKEGACTLDESGRFIQIHPPKITVANTTGAGDSFTGGFLYGRNKGKNMEESLVLGVLSGSLTAASHDSLSDKINIANIEEMKAQIKGDKSA